MTFTRRSTSLADGGTLLLALLLPSGSLAAQAIPVELTAGSQYATANLVLSKSFAATSRFGVFHQSTLTADYRGDTDDDIAVQQLLTFEPVSGFRLTGGAFWGGSGFSPTAGLQYARAGRTFFLLLSPRMNLEGDPSFSVFSIVRYRPRLANDTRLYLAAQLLSVFEPDRHLRSYQWLRAGLDVRGTQFGAALNFDKDAFAADPGLRVSVGLFVRREIS